MNNYLTIGNIFFVIMKIKTNIITLLPLCLLLTLTFEAKPQTKGQKRDTVIVIQKEVKVDTVYIGKQKQDDGAQKSFENALEVLNSSTGIFSNILTALTIILALIGGFIAFFGIMQYKDLKEKIKESASKIEKAGAEQLKQIKEPVKQIKDAADYINGIKSNIEKQSKEVDEMRTALGKQSFLLDKDAVSPEDKEKLSELSRRLEMLEVLGVSMKPKDYLSRGNDLFHKNNFPLALTAYKKAIELKPDYVSAWNNKGVILGNLKRYDEALKAFEKVIELIPGYADAWYNKGAILGNLKRYDEALKASEKAIELKPDYVSAWNNKGVILCNLKRYDEALKASEKAIELKPDHASAWYNIACIYSLKNDKPNALKNLEKAINLNIQYKKQAKANEDFKNLWDDADFKKIVS